MAGALTKMLGGPASAGSGLSLDFTTGSLPAGVSYSGGTNGTRINSSGVMVAASGARFDYDPNTLAALGILCEPSRQQIFSSTENFNDSSWNPLNTTITTNTTAAPDGNTTADSMTIINASLNRWVRKIAVPWTSGINGAFSVYAKSSTSSAALIVCTNNSVAWSTGTATKFSLTSSWQRCAIAGVLETGQSLLNTILGNTKVDGTTDGTIPNETVVIWGAQLEIIASGERAEASTYIPSTAGGTTRAADVISFTIPSGISTLTYTFDDNSTQTKSVSAGSYTVPTNLNRARIKTIVGS